MEGRQRLSWSSKARERLSIIFWIPVRGGVRQPPCRHCEPILQMHPSLGSTVDGKGKAGNGVNPLRYYRESWAATLSRNTGLEDPVFPKDPVF